MVDLTIWLGIGSIASIATIAAFIILAYETTQLRKERKIMFRAWIGDFGTSIIPVKVLNKKGESMTIDEWKSEKMSDEMRKQFDAVSVETAINLKNFGQIPAVNVQGRYKIILDKQPSRKKILPEELKEILPEEFGPVFVIMPQGESLYMFDDYGATFHVSEGKTAYLILDIKYNSASLKDERRFGFIAKMTRGSYRKIDS